MNNEYSLISKPFDLLFLNDLNGCPSPIYLFILLLLLYIHFSSPFPSPLPELYKFASVIGQVFFCCDSDWLPFNFYLFVDEIILFVIFLQKNAFNNNKRQFGQRSCKRNKATIVLKSFDCNWVLFSLNISMNTMKIFKGQCFLESTFYEE